MQRQASDGDNLSWNLKRAVMIYRWLLLLLGMTGAWSAAAQEGAPTTRQALYLEGAGIGGYGSLNYERLLHQPDQWHLAARAALSTYNLKDYRYRFNPDVLVPFGLSAYYGRRHHLDLGIGATAASIVMADRTDFTPVRTLRFHSWGSVGYRFQRPGGGLVIRATYTPLLEYNRLFRHWAGVSIGYAF